MIANTTINQPQQLIVTLEENAAVTDIKRLLKSIRGISSVKKLTNSKRMQQENLVKGTLIPALRETKQALAEGKEMKTIDEFLRELD